MAAINQVTQMALGWLRRWEAMDAPVMDNAPKMTRAIEYVLGCQVGVSKWDESCYTKIGQPRTPGRLNYIPKS